MLEAAGGGDAMQKLNALGGLLAKKPQNTKKKEKTEKSLFSMR